MKPIGFRSCLAPALLSVLYCCVVAAEPVPSLPGVTVIAPRPPTPEELAGEAVPDFVRAHTAPSTVIHQITRWRDGICPLTRGLESGSNAFVTARIRAIAALVGAPHQDSPDCKANVQILFTLEPQKVLDAVARQDSRMLGFHYSQQDKPLVTMTRPIQGWYVTSTRNFKGIEMIDDPLPLGAQQGSFGTPTGYLPNSRVPPGEPGSRLTNLQSSQVVLALIVVDANSIKGMAIGPLSDYLAMLTLSQTRSPGSCSQLPSIMDLMAPKCDRSEKPPQITAGDIAFLRALYRINPEMSLEVAESSIEDAMTRDLNKH
jgi:hypothetical protein